MSTIKPLLFAAFLSLFSALPVLPQTIPLTRGVEGFLMIPDDAATSLHLRDSGPVPELSCRSAVLLDARTGAVLYAKNPEEIIPPASMTKLVSLHLIFEEIEAGRLSLNQEFIVPASADFRNAPPRSSLMFLQEGQRVSLLDLMRGLALPSGNDAAVFVADLIAGSMESYVDRMNEEMRRLGFDSISFEDASGYSEFNRASALDFARFCRLYIEKYPESLKELHNLSSFTYPGEGNITGAGQSLYGGISQNNTNSLIGRHPWVDGIKTGYIDEAGYNVALTAEAGGRRLIAVLMGGPGENTRDGDLHRVIDGVNLLSYGFYRFDTLVPAFPDIPDMPVIGGIRKSTGLRLPVPEALILPREELGALRWVYEAGAALRAPVEEGERAGTLYLLTDERVLREFPLRAEESVPKASFLRRLADSLSTVYSVPEAAQ
jgi:D-alanyl-D-alanine carboxypeptidase (penicillin-binding protein 5/6)